MTLDSIITMGIILGGVWGGFLFLLLRSFRGDEGEDRPDYS